LKAFVIFDRDGTIIDHVHHLKDPELVRIKLDLVESLSKLRKAGFGLGMVTNQSIIGRGIATHQEVNAINEKVFNHLASHHLAFDFVYICPHLDEDNCECRKPALKLGQRAIIEHDLTPAQSYVIGDQESDLIFGKNLGCSTIQVKANAEKSGYADYYSETLSQAVNWILSRAKS
jgi:D-glycero-D-manno-heptose 1,7-bisphosphate phosphatase